MPLGARFGHAIAGMPVRAQGAVGGPGPLRLTRLLAWDKYVPDSNAREDATTGTSVRTWGGRRKGAGRKPAPRRRSVPHRRRPVHDPHCPVHVTLRAARPCPPSGTDGSSSPHETRSRPRARRASVCFSSRFRRTIYTWWCKRMSRRASSGACAASRSAVAKAVNRVLARHGRVWGDRYHARLLRTPREVRNALVYVLNNFRKHVRDAAGLDSRSSAVWFTGWSNSVDAPAGRSPVVAARTWLARVGWMRHGRIGFDEVPRAAR